MRTEEKTAAGKKFQALLELLGKAGSAVLAFSGGVDSSFLLKAMKTAGVRTLAVTAVSETLPAREKEKAVSFARQLGMEQRIIRTGELGNESFASNPPERCFYCKDELFSKLAAISREEGCGFVFDGTNSDDLRDYRPGRLAAERHGVRSPLAECGFSKAEIRTMSRELGLDTWDRPSSPCLSSRFAYGTRITAPALRRVEKAEEFLEGFGLRDLRVRDDGSTARIEVREEDMHILLDARNRRLIAGKLKSLGYKFVSLDLEGYRSGSLNRVLDRPEAQRPPAR
ncbi:MAG: ATP-dependent sacrificial sulfur transferase LarE [Candidatus Sulfobium sp.]